MRRIAANQVRIDTAQTTNQTGARESLWGKDAGPALATSQPRGRIPHEQPKGL